MASFKVLVVLSLVVSLVLGLPIKDDEIDELIYRLQELRNQNHYEGIAGNDNTHPHLPPNDKYHTRSLDSLGGGFLIRNAPQSFNEHDEYNSASVTHPSNSMLVAHMRPHQHAQAARQLDSIGGGYLVRNLDSLGGGHLVRNLDSLGGGNLVRNLDSLGGGNLVRNLDSIGGGYLVRSALDGGDWQTIDSPPKRNLDSLGGANLLKRNLDSLGGANLLKRSLDSLGGANLLKRSLDSLGGANLLKRSLDSLGGANLLKRSLDSLGGANLLKRK